MKYCGIDLHSNNSVVIVSDEEDRIVLSKRLPNELGQIGAALEPHREDLAGVVIESTYNWYWLVDGLMATGYQVHLAHPSAIKKYEGLKYSGDFADAGYLAQLLRLGLLAEGYILSARRAWGARPFAQAHAAGALPHGADSGDREHPRPADRCAAERRGGQAADGRTSRGTWLCARCGTGRGGQPRG